MVRKRPFGNICTKGYQNNNLGKIMIFKVDKENIISIFDKNNESVNIALVISNYDSVQLVGHNDFKTKYIRQVASSKVIGIDNKQLSNFFNKNEDLRDTEFYYVIINTNTNSFYLMCKGLYSATSVIENINNSKNVNELRIKQ